MEIQTEQWFYIENKTWGRMFAADKDMENGDHNVETDPNFGDGQKYQWMFHPLESGGYLISNRAHGFMFAADGDKKGKDHIVECDASVTTLDAARKKAESNSKWIWEVTKTDNRGYTVTNKRYGQTFAADEDKKDNDHLVESRPDAKETANKWYWKIYVKSVE